MKKMLMAALAATLVLGCKSQSPQQESAPFSVQQKKPVEISGRWDGQVARALAGIIEQAKPAADGRAPVAVFDFDNTCIRGDIGRAFFDYMVTNMKIRASDEVWAAFPADLREDLRQAWESASRLPEEKRQQSLELARLRKLMHKAYWSLCRESDAEKCYPWQVRFYSGYTPQEITAIAEKVFADELVRPLGSEQLRAGQEDQSPAITATGIRIVPEIKSLIALLNERGFEVWVISAGPQWVVAGGAKSLGVEPERVLGMRAKLDQGKLTAEIDPPPTTHQGKVEAIKKFIGARPALAVGDTWADNEMLEYAEHALLIDRGYADLRQKAENSGWLIQPAFSALE